MFKDLLGINAAEDKFLGRFNRALMVTDGGFSGGGFVDDTEIDDPNIPDKDGDKDVELVELPTDDEVSDDFSGGDEDLREEEVEQEPELKKEPTVKEKTYTKAEMQTEIDRVLADRLSRERAKIEADKQAEKRQAQVEAEAKTYWIEQQTEKEEYFAALGFDETKAKKLASEEIKKEQRIARLEQELISAKQQIEFTGKSTDYERQRQAVLNSNPQIRPYAIMYAAEIDAVSQNGAAIDFETAMKFVIGEKFTSGELRKSVKTAAEQKTLANIKGRQKLRVEDANLPVGSKSEQVDLTPLQKHFAARLDMSEKDFASGITKKSKKRR